MEEIEMKEQHLTVVQASELTRIAIKTISNACKSGQLKASEVPSAGKTGWKYIIAKSDLFAWVENRKAIKAVPNTKAKGTLAEYSYEEIAEELYRREKTAYERGLKEGVKQAKAEIANALKGVKA